MSIDPTSTDVTEALFHGEATNTTPAPTATTARLLAMVGRDKAVLELGNDDVEPLWQLLVASGCRVVSVVSNSGGRDRAEPYCERVIVGDVELLDLERETENLRFDVVVAAELLTRVKDPSALLRKITRLLQPCGYLVGGVPNVAHISVRLSMLAGRSPYDGDVTSPSHLRFYTREILTRLFDDAGFTIARLERQEQTVELAGPDLGAFVMPGLVEALRKDPDASTSHFLVAAYHLPSPAGGALRIAVNELRERGEELEVETARAARTIEGLRIEVCGYQREIEQRDDAVRALNAQASRRDEIVQSLSLQLDQHRTELSRITGVLEQSRGELGATVAELDRHRGEVAAMTDRLARERAEAAEARAEVAAMTDRFARECAEAAEARAEVAAMTDRFARECAEAAEARAEVAAMTDRFARECAEAAEARAEVAAMTDRFARECAEAAEARAEVATLAAELVTASGRADALKVQLERKRTKWEGKIADQRLALLAERGAVASVRKTACRVAAQAAALRDSRAMRVARWLRGDPDLWERVPAAFAALKRDAIQYGFRTKGYALRESVNLQRGSIFYPFNVRLNGVRGVALEVIIPAPGCGGVIGAELIAPSNDVVTRGTLSLDLVSDRVPTVIQFGPADLGDHGWGLRVFVADSPSPVRILEFQRYSLPIQRALVRRPFCSIIVSPPAC